MTLQARDSHRGILIARLAPDADQKADSDMLSAPLVFDFFSNQDIGIEVRW